MASSSRSQRSLPISIDEGFPLLFLLFLLGDSIMDGTGLKLGAGWCSRRGVGWKWRREGRVAAWPCGDVGSGIFFSQRGGEHGYRRERSEVTLGQSDYLLQ